MSARAQAALLRLAKTVVAGALAAVVAFVASPQLADVVGTQYAVLVAAVLTPILMAAEKYFNWTDAPPTPAPNPPVV